MKAGLAIFAVALVSAPALASETEWQTVAPQARLRVISSDQLDRGKITIALELELAPGWKTYWRVPGEGGIPTSLQVRQGDTQRNADILWPIPQWDVALGYAEFVYRNRLVLPARLDIDVADAAPFDIEAILGICSDVCVPVKAVFQLPVRAGNMDVAQDLRIRQAIADVPIPWDGANDPVTDISFDRETGRLRFSMDPATLDPAHVFVTVEGANLGFSPPKPVPGAQNRLEMRLLAREGTAVKDSVFLRFTFLTAGGAYELVRPLGSG